MRALFTVVVYECTDLRRIAFGTFAQANMLDASLQKRNMDI